MWLNSFFTNPMNLFMILCFYCYNWLLVTGYWLLPLLTYFSQRRKDAKLYFYFLNVCKSGGRCKVSWLIYFFYLFNFFYTSILRLLIDIGIGWQFFFTFLLPLITANCNCLPFIFFLAIPIACLPTANCQLLTAYCCFFLFLLNVCKSGGRCKVFFIFHLNVCKSDGRCKVFIFFFLTFASPLDVAKFLSFIF
jgi:hypothetical protein